MLKWIAIIVGVWLIGLCTVGYLYKRSVRHAGIIVGKSSLKMAYKDFTERGFVTNYGATGYEVWLSSNTVFIGGTQYQCLITVRENKFFGQGTLAITTNQIFIWLDAKRSPKLIEPGYRPPLFPPRF
jgi:hypothetical protein